MSRILISTNNMRFCLQILIIQYFEIILFSGALIRHLIFPEWSGFPDLRVLEIILRKVKIQGENGGVMVCCGLIIITCKHYVIGILMTLVLNECQGNGRCVLVCFDPYVPSQTLGFSWLWFQSSRTPLSEIVLNLIPAKAMSGWPNYFSAIHLDNEFV